MHKMCCKKADVLCWPDSLSLSTHAPERYARNARQERTRYQYVVSLELVGRKMAQHGGHGWWSFRWLREATSTSRTFCFCCRYPSKFRNDGAHNAAEAKFHPSRRGLLPLCAPLAVALHLILLLHHCWWRGGITWMLKHRPLKQRKPLQRICRRQIQIQVPLPLLLPTPG